MNDWDSYFMPGTQTLLNRAGITDAKQLQQYEYELSGQRALELAEEPIRGNFDLPHLRAIHKHLFQDVYPWAGEIRTVRISKGNSAFARPEAIEGYGREIFRNLAKDDHLKGLGNEAFAAGMGKHYGEINALHPFREGNGRSTRVFLEQLALEAGYRLDFRRVNGEEWIQAARESFEGNPKAITEVFAKISIPSRAIAFEHEPRDAALAKHPELAIAFAALDKTADEARRTIADPEQHARLVASAKAVLVDALTRGTLSAPENLQPQREPDRGVER